MINHKIDGCDRIDDHITYCQGYTTILSLKIIVRLKSPSMMPDKIENRDNTN